MMTNLFSIFDPCTSYMNSFNWVSMVLCLTLLPLNFWVLQSRRTAVFNKIFNYIFKEFKPLITKNPQILLLSVCLFIFIIMNNVPGLLPYVFTSTSHILVTLSLALPLWIALMTHGWIFNTSNLLVHLIPNGTPTILMPFMVLIETISNMIRPLTLAIRLAANMIAGHLLITLLTGAAPATPLIFLPLIAGAQLALASLELAVAFIQGYVFSVLITLYAAESVSYDNPR